MYMHIHVQNGGQVPCSLPLGRAPTKKASDPSPGAEGDLHTYMRVHACMIARETSGATKSTDLGTVAGAPDMLLWRQHSARGSKDRAAWHSLLTHPHPTHRLENGAPRCSEIPGLAPTAD